MKTKIAIADRRYSNWQRGQSHPGSWRIIWEYEGKEIPKDIPRDIPLTPRAVTHWKAHKDIMGTAAFRGETIKDSLTTIDIKSIVSATKRGEATMYINRMGQVIGYKIK